VRIIIPAVSNQRLADLARSTCLRQIHEAGARVYRYMGGNFHGKTLLIDDRFGFVGSMNVDRRSIASISRS
jgi:cardiolipin synthase